MEGGKGGVGVGRQERIWLKMIKNHLNVDRSREEWGWGVGVGRQERIWLKMN